MLPYIGALAGDFVYDDGILIRATDDAGPAAAFTTGLWRDLPGAGYYRPLVSLSLMLDALVSGTGPVGFHASNLVLHLLLVLSAWQLLRHLTGCDLTAAAAAALFAVHPVHVEAVAWISGRGDLLAPLLACLAWLAWTAGGWLPSARPPRDVPSPGLLAAGGLALLAALLAKESAVAMLPVMLIATAAVVGRHRDELTPAWRRRVTFAAIVAAGALAITLALRIAALGSLTGPYPVDPWENPAAGAPLLVRLATSMGAFARALGLLLWPHPLRVDYGVPVLRPLEPTAPLALLGAGLFLLCAGAAVALLRAGRAPGGTSHRVGFGLALMVLAWLPVSSLGPAAGALLAERYLVLPSLGVALVAGALVAAALRATTNRTGALLIGGLLAVTLLSLGARSAWRVPIWRDETRLFAADLDHPPVSFRIATFQGMQSYAAGRDADSRRWFETAVGAAPGFSRAWEGLARASLRQGDLPAAVSAAQEAVRQEPATDTATRARYRELVAETLVAAGRAKEALEVLREAVATFPDAPGPALQLGDTLFAQGRLTAAIGAYRVAAERGPEEPLARYNLGVTLALLDRGQEAVTVLQELAGRPGAPPETHYHLGVLAQQSGDEDAARAHYRTFIIAASSRTGSRRLVEMQQEARRRLDGLGPASSAP